MARLSVTIRTVAERAGVSLMTVSRVLRNHDSVSAETRRKVLQAVDETGYRPNPLVGAWMSHMRSSLARSTDPQTLAFLMAERDRKNFHATLTLRHYYEGACMRAEQLGFKIEPFWLADKGMTGPRMSTILQARGISGVLVAPIPRLVGTVDLDWERFASVVFGYSMREPNLHRVTNHQIHSMRLAIAETTRLGYRRIGLALDRSKDVRVDYNWTTGMLPYQMSIPARNRVPPLLPDEITRDLLLKWVEKERPEVILAGREDMVVWLEEAGWSVPDKIGFVSLEYYPEYGDLAGVDQNSVTIGLAAVELLVEQLYHNKRGIPARPKVVMIESCWHPGGSLRQVRSPSAAGVDQSNS